MSNEQSPWSQPDPRWQPQSYRDVTGRDPRQPFAPPHGQTPGPQPSIEDFRDRRPGSGRKWWIVAALVTVIAVVVVALQFLGGDAGDSPGAAGSPTASATTGTSPTPAVSQPATGGATSIPFEGNGTGTFELLKETWDATGVDIEFRVSVDSGQEGFTVFMFNNASMEVADPVLPTEFTVSAGSPHVGSARFEAVRGPGTFVLANWMGRALTALPIKG